MLLTEKPKAASTAAAWEGETVVIEPRHPWRKLGLGEIWSHRELLYFFIWRDLKVRYKQTAFGAAWGPFSSRCS